MSPPSSSQPQRIKIRKYPNRRYYDATRSRHVTLDEIRRLIQEGHEIEVTDSQTNRNITAQVLTQIILDLENQKMDLFPVGFLMQLIRMNDQTLRDAFSKYMQQNMMSFFDLQKQMGQTWPAAGAEGAAPPWAQAFWQPFAPQSAPEEPAPEPAAEEPSAPTTEDVLHDRIAQLEAQLARLESHLRKPAAASRRGPRRTGKK